MCKPESIFMIYCGKEAILPLLSSTRRVLQNFLSPFFKREKIFCLPPFPVASVVQCYVVDSLAASFGEGLMVLKLAELRKKGFSIQEARDWLEQSKLKMRQVFTVGDLHFLRRGGRLSGAAAFVGSLLNIKPLLKGNEEGQIVLNGKTRGMKKALDSLAKDLQEHIVSPETQTIAIAHCDCESDATYLADKIRSLVNVKDIIIRYYDLCTGAHVGPGTVALFYMGDHR